MVRVIKNKPFSKKLKASLSSPFFIPYIILFFATITIPVIYLVLQHPFEIRQRAATIASGSVVVNTNESSFQNAAAQIIPPTTFNTIISVLVIIAVVSFGLLIVFYRRRYS